MILHNEEERDHECVHVTWCPVFIRLLMVFVMVGVAFLTLLERKVLGYIHVGYAVAQLVEALCYKPERRGFDSRWCYWNF
jgi:hypothetical protein